MLATVVVTGYPAWADRLESELARYELRLVRYVSTDNFVERLVDDQARILFVDAAREDWVYWTAAARNSPATRRIPVVLVGDTVSDEAAYEAGATDRVFVDDLADMIEVLALRISQPAGNPRVNELDRQCGQSLPPEALEGIRLFNAGQYYRQHDVFEALWMAEGGPVRDLYRAVLQVGIAYYQIERGNYRGAVKMLLRSQQWLNDLPDVCRGVDVARLRNDADRVRRALAAVGPQGLHAFDRGLLRPVRLVEDADQTAVQ